MQATLKPSTVAEKFAIQIVEPPDPLAAVNVPAGATGVNPVAPNTGVEATLSTSVQALVTPLARTEQTRKS